MRYESGAANLILAAARRARGLGHSYVGSVHLLMALSEEPGRLGLLLRQYGAEPELLRKLTAALYGVGTPDLPLPQGFSSGAERILARAAEEAGALGRRSVDVGHILLALLRHRDGGAGELLSLCGADADGIFTETLEFLRQTPAVKRKKEGTTTKLLEQFSEDLILKAQSMEPVIGREKEIDMVIGILSRKNKNNPALIGEPGVGKTAIAEGLAQRMAMGNVPPQLKEKRLVSLNMAIKHCENSMPIQRVLTK